MNPEYSTPQIDTSQNNRRLIVITAALFGLIVIVVVAFSLLLSAAHPDYRLTKTPLNGDRNFSHLQGSDLYSYNGLAFTKLDIKTGEITTLNKGIKLPAPKAIYWAGSQGALINFDHSFILTKVDDQLVGTDAEFDQTAEASLSWYLNFSDGSLHQVTDAPIAAGQAVFSEAEHGFYYALDMGDVEVDGPIAATPIHFYNITTDQDKTISENLDIANVTHLASCSDTSYKLCVIGNDSDNATQIDLYGISATGKKTVLLKSSGRLIPTNSPDLFITTDQESNVGGGSEDSSYTNAPAQLHNLKDKSVSKLGFDIAGEQLMPYIFSPKSFYVFNGQQSTDTDKYTSGATTIINSLDTKKLPLRYIDGSDFAGILRDGIGYGDNNTSLVTDADGNTLLFTTRDNTIQTPSVDTKTAQNTVNACLKTTGTTNEYFSDTTLFKVYFKTDANFAKNIAAFSDCVAKTNAKTLIGYNFYFGGVDPVNGRITTD